MLMDRYRIEINVSVIEKGPGGRLVPTRSVLHRDALLHTESDAEALEQARAYADGWIGGELARSHPNVIDAHEVAPVEMP